MLIREWQMVQYRQTDRKKNGWSSQQQKIEKKKEIYLGLIFNIFFLL